MTSGSISPCCLTPAGSLIQLPVASPVLHGLIQQKKSFQSIEEFVLGQFSTSVNLLGTIGEAQDIPAQMKRERVTGAVVREQVWKRP